MNSNQNCETPQYFSKAASPKATQPQAKNDSETYVKEVTNLIQFENDRLKIVTTKSKHTILQLINQLRSKVSFYGIMKLFDANEHQKVTNEKLQRENDLMKEMLKQQGKMIEQLKQDV